MTTSPIEPLPSSYSWGFVVARAIHATADSIDDPDRFPEARGSNGRVTFTPTINFKKVLEPPTAFVQHEVVQADIVDGVMIDAEGLPGIYLISGVYRVSFSIQNGSIPSFTIEVTDSHTTEDPLDLVTAAPYTPGPGVSVETLLVDSGVQDGQLLVRSGDRVLGIDSDDLSIDVEAEIQNYFNDNPIDVESEVDQYFIDNPLPESVPQMLSGDAARFRGIFESEPETLPDLQIGDWIIVLGD